MHAVDEKANPEQCKKVEDVGYITIMYKEYGFQMIMICYPYLLHFLFLNNMREV